MESSNMSGVSYNVNGRKEVSEQQLFGSQEYPYESHTHTHTHPEGHMFPHSHTALELRQQTTHSSYATLVTEIYS